MRRRFVFLGALTLFAVVVAAGPAAAKGGGGGSHDRRISLSGALVVATGEVVNGPAVSVDGPATIAGRVNDDVFVGHGRLTVSGHVTGDVLIVDGDATITGRVDGDITALHGRVTVQAGGSVHGDITSSNAPRAAPGTVRGHVKTLDVTSIFTGFLVAFLIILWVAVTVSIGILGLLFVVVFPHGADAVVLAGRRVGVSIVTGLLVGIIGPVLGVAIVSTIVGIPLGIGLLAAMTVLAPLGYASSALILGRLMVRGPRTRARVGAFLAGFAILRLVALIPGLGFIVWYLACFYGLGALTIAAWRAGRRETAPPVTTAPGSPVETPPTPAAVPPEPESGSRAGTTSPSARPRATPTPARRRPTRATPKKTTAKKTAKQSATRKPVRTARAPAKKRTGRPSATPRRAPAKATTRRPRPAAKRSTARAKSAASRRAPRQAAGTARRSR